MGIRPIYGLTGGIVTFIMMIRFFSRRVIRQPVLYPKIWGSPTRTDIFLKPDMMHHILFRIIFIIVITAPAGISTIKRPSAEQDSGVLHSPGRTILPGAHRDETG